MSARLRVIEKLDAVVAAAALVERIEVGCGEFMPGTASYDREYAGALAELEAARAALLEEVAP